MKETWDVPKALCSEKCKGDLAIQYMYNILGNSNITQQERNMINILLKMIDIIEYDRDYVASSRDHLNKLTEQDYQTTIWSPIFRHLFRSKSDMPAIRVKVGESIFNYTTQQKKQHYSNDPNVAGYKIDMRIIADIEDSECDIGSGELAKVDNLKKIIDDEAKLFREGKDVVDHLAKLPYIDDFPISWQIQIANCQCQLSTIHLVADGLYVGVRQFDRLKLPKSFTDLDCGMLTLRVLITMELAMRKTVDKLPALYNQPEQMNKHLGIHYPPEDNFTPWARPTFYTPPRSVPPRISKNLLKRKPFDLNERLQKIRHIDQLEEDFPTVQILNFAPKKSAFL